MITDELAKSIIGDDSDAFILLRVLKDGNIEVATATNGRINHQNMTALAQVAVDAVAEAVKRHGCLCPACQAAKALSHNAPKAQA